MILQWSRARGRVYSTEVADLTGLSKVSAGKLLTALADAGHLEGSGPNGSAEASSTSRPTPAKIRGMSTGPDNRWMQR